MPCHYHMKVPIILTLAGGGNIPKSLILPWVKPIHVCIFCRFRWRVFYFFALPQNVSDRPPHCTVSSLPGVAHGPSSNRSLQFVQLLELRRRCSNEGFDKPIFTSISLYSGICCNARTHTHNCGNTQRHTSVTCMVAIPKNQNSHTRTCIYGVFYICTHCIRRTFVHICFQLVPFGNRVASTKCLQGKA